MVSSLKSIIVKKSKKAIRMSSLWSTNCQPPLFFYHVSNAAATPHQEKRELSEFKAIYIIKDYFLLLFQSIQKSTQELSNVLFRLFALLQKNGRKSHRYEKKTVFDILGVVSFQFQFIYTSPISTELLTILITIQLSML